MGEPARCPTSGTTCSARCTFSGEFAVDFDDETDIWCHENNAERVWKRYFEAIAESAQTGLFDVITPRSREDLGLGHGHSRPRDPRFYYEPAIEAMLDAGVAMEVSTAGLRKPVEEIYPARGDAGDGGRRGYSDRALPQRSPTGPRVRLREGGEVARRDCGVNEIAGVRAAGTPDGAAR